MFQVSCLSSVKKLCIINLFSQRNGCLKPGRHFGWKQDPLCFFVCFRTACLISIYSSRLCQYVVVIRASVSKLRGSCRCRTLDGRVRKQRLPHLRYFRTSTHSAIQQLFVAKAQILEGFWMYKELFLKSWLWLLYFLCPLVCKHKNADLQASNTFLFIYQIWFL